jgi:hypothetical protein
VKIYLEKKAYRNEGINLYLIEIDDKSIVNSESNNNRVNKVNNDNVIHRRNEVDE